MTSPPFDPKLARSEHLEQALAARDRQLSIATHELRTPISSILLNLQVLERTASAKGALDASAIARLLEIPLRQLRRLMHMVDLLLDSAQVESARLALDLQAVDLQDVVHDVTVRLTEMARAAGCEIVALPGPPVVGRWDRLRLEQVLHNLLTNAIKYGGGRVEVRTWLDGEAHLQVSDHGSGIAAEDHAHIFEPFKRLPTSSGEDGAGLGLYIVREIVHAHGGHIEVQGPPGAGATFLISLPTDTST